jgi:repressor LexA
MEMPLTKRQKQVLNYIVKEIESKGYPPSIREIGKALNITTLRGVTCHLDALEKKGYIKRDSTSRGIKIISSTINGFSALQNQDVIKLPLLGRVAAGTPILAEQNIEDWISVPKELVKNNKKVFLLRVRDESMINDHILDGDLVIVKSQTTAENGDTVVSIINNGATVKRFYRKNNHIELRPSNPKYKPLILKEDFRINGKVIGLLRI